MLQDVVTVQQTAMNFLSTELNKFGANFPEDIGKGALDGLNEV